MIEKFERARGEQCCSYGPEQRNQVSFIRITTSVYWIPY